MKRIILNAALIVLLFGLAPATLFAQGELTLEGLSERLGLALANVVDLSERVTAIEERVADLENDPAGFCSPSVKGYHPMTLAGIDSDSPGYEVELYPDISHVRLNAGTGEIIVQWQSCCTEIVTEYYDGRCQWTGYELK